MAHNTIGLDLGSSEVRAVVVRISLRSREVIRVEREPVELDENGRSSVAKMLEAAGRIIKRLDVSDETIHCAVTGELASIRKVILPASAARRLDQVLKFELDEVLPFDIEDATFDYVETARSNKEIAVLSATIPTERLEELLAGLAAQNISPREVGVDTFSYLNAIATGEEKDEVTAFVDIGHARTNIAILDPAEPTVRTVLRGARQLTEKLAEAGAVPYEKAEIFKREYGLTGKVGDVLRESLRPLVREIQQTFKGHLASGGSRVTKVTLSGGGALLLGLDRYLADALGVPVDIYELPAKSPVRDEDDVRGGTFALAYMLALREEVPRTKRIDIRRGSLAFRGDFESIKRQLKWVAVGVLAIILSWVVSSIAELSALADRVDSQKLALETRTKELFGRPMADPQEIAEELNGTVKKEESPMPVKDAFDVLIEISKRIPPTVVHDVEQLDIKSKRVMMKGMVNADLKTESDADTDTDTDTDTDDTSPNAPEPEDPLNDPAVAGEGSDLTPTDLLKKKMEEFTECFTAVRMGKVTTVNDRRRYQMDIDSQCP